jgi:hypothetical protein
LEEEVKKKGKKELPQPSVKSLFSWKVKEKRRKRVVENVRTRIDR